MICGIYVITNKINNKEYYGKSVDVKNRMKRSHHDCPVIVNAIKKYGEENFVFEILLICEISELTYYEQKYFNILKPEYNIRKECIDSNKGLKHSDETKKRISVSSKRNMSNPDIIKKNIRSKQWKDSFGGN